jgi:hypothetical protein
MRQIETVIWKRTSKSLLYALFYALIVIVLHFTLIRFEVIMLNL